MKRLRASAIVGMVFGLGISPVGAAAAEVAGVAVRLNGKDVAGIAITYDDHTEAQLWALLNDHYLTFERDFAIPVKPDDANAATLEGKIVVHPS